MPQNFNQYQPYTGFTIKDPNTGTAQDFGQRYTSKSYLLDAYPNLVPGRTVPGLQAWGDNTGGQLGNNSNTVYYSSPVQVGALTNWRQVAGGLGHTAAIKTDGTLWTWGLNTNGQLGNSTLVNYSSPVQVGSLTSWRQVACGYYFNGAVDNTGALWTWGINNFGQLGNSTIVQYSSPIQVGALTSWRQVVGGLVHIAAVKTDGTLWTCGYGGLGQLGNSTSTSYSSPVQVGALTTWSRVACGTYHTAAITTNGALWTWGQNSSGQLGVGTIVNYSSPVQVGSLTNWRQVAGSVRSLITVKTDGTLWTWGYNSSGQLGVGNTVSYSSPVQVGSLTNWRQAATIIANINNAAAAVKTDGTLWSWGYNSVGQLGYQNTGYDVTLLNHSSPTQVGSLTTWSQVAGGAANSAAIKIDGTLWGWGYNTFGQLGNGANGASYSSPIQVGALTTWSQVSAGLSGHVMVIKTNNTLWAIGRNIFGQLGNGTFNISYSSPIQVGALTNWKQVSCGYGFAAAITTGGALWSWGINTYGQLGNGFNSPTVYYSSPVQVGSLTNWRQVSCGNPHTAAVKTDGTLWTWGQNSFGQLGVGTTVYYSSPIQVGALTTWSQVACGQSHTAAVDTTGKLWTWGSNSFGQSGNGNQINYSSPIQVGSLTTWSQVSAGNSLTAAVKTDGTLWAWGNDNYGQLGNGTRVYYSSPIQVGSLTTWGQVACGSYHTLAITTGTSGALFTWGYNAQAQLGYFDLVLNNIENSSSPTQVGALTTWKQVAGGQSHIMAIKDGYL